VDAQIHAAIVGALIGGATIAGGVILDLRVRSRQERRRQLATVVDELGRLNGRFRDVAAVGHFDIDRFGETNAHIIELTGQARRLADALGRRRSRAIRDAASDLSDMWQAMLMRATKQIRENKPIGEVGEDKLVVFTLTMPIRRMNVALYGEGQPAATPDGPFGRMLRYVEEGLSAPDLDHPENVDVRTWWQRAFPELHHPKKGVARRTWRERLLRPRPIHPDGKRSRLPK